MVLATDGAIVWLLDSLDAPLDFPDIQGLTTIGNDLYILDNNGSVHKVTGGLGGTFTADWATFTGQTSADSITAFDGKIIIGDEDGMLRAVDVGTGGAMQAYGAGIGYQYNITGLHGGADGKLYMAQPHSSAVRTKPSDSDTATIVSAGSRIHFGAVQRGDSWFLTSMGLGLFGSDDPPGDGPVEDGALIEVAADGRSRVVAPFTFPVDLVLDGAGDLVVSDCGNAAISKVDASTGALTPILDSSDGLICPAGLHYAANGDLFYTDPDIGAETDTVVARYTAAGAHDRAFVTGVPSTSISLTGDGDKLFIGPLRIGGEDGFQMAGVYSASATTTGAATLLAHPAAVGSLSTLAVSPQGVLFGMRLPSGDVITIDPTSGDVSTFGSANIGLFGVAPLFQDGDNFNIGLSGSFALGFHEDGTMLVPDVFQGELISIAP